jgi:hypothetical protein
VVHLVDNVYQICLAVRGPSVCQCISNLLGRPRSICLAMYIEFAWPSAVHLFGNVYEICLAVRGPPGLQCISSMPGRPRSTWFAVYIKYAWPSAVHLFVRIHLASRFCQKLFIKLGAFIIHQTCWPSVVHLLAKFLTKTGGRRDEFTQPRGVPNSRRSYYIKHAWPSVVHLFNSVYQTCLAVRGPSV